jgi:selenide,water dikinase
MHRAAELRRRIDALAARPVVRTADGVRGRRAVVVGAGAAGAEVACAIATAFDRESPRSADEDAVSLVDAAETILPGYSKRFRTRARQVLEERGIDVWTRTRVTEVTADEVRIELRGRASALPSNLSVWLTGAAAPPIFRGLTRNGTREGALPLDERGFLLVDPSLRSPADERIFGAGDCVTPAEHPDTPKAGVYAVREAPLLWQSLRATLTGTGAHPRYEPQDSFLSILNTADGKALLRWKWIVSHGRWAWWLKDRIDRRFVSNYELGIRN